MTAPVRLHRSRERPRAPVRIVHLGLGNFFRAHQARYTDLAPDASKWGIAAFGGRSGELAQRMSEQDGLYTLVTRGPRVDQFDVVASVSRAYGGADHDQWLRHLSAPQTACVTVTVTEFGYRRGADGGLDTGAAEVQRDISELRAALRSPVVTAPARLVAGLAARRQADAGPIAVMSCDNLLANGRATHRVVTELAERVDPGLRVWIESSVSFPSSMVDRITPHQGADLEAIVADATGARDGCPVVTEPFTEWVLAGEFPGGCPDWVRAGVTLVSSGGDVEAHERRKLLLLNGAHSLLAYAGSNRGLRTVADAISDHYCLELVRQWWSESISQVALPESELRDYCDRLLERWSNPRIDHLLSQIAADGSQKLPVRVIPVLRAQRADGRMPTACIAIIAEWVRYLRRAGAGVEVIDAGLAAAPLALDGPPPELARTVLARLSGGDEALVGDDALIAALAGQAR